MQNATSRIPLIGKLFRHTIAVMVARPATARAASRTCPYHGHDHLRFPLRVMGHEAFDGSSGREMLGERARECSLHAHTANPTNTSGYWLDQP